MIKRGVWSKAVKALAALCLLAVMSGIALSGIKTSGASSPAKTPVQAESSAEAGGGANDGGLASGAGTARGADAATDASDTAGAAAGILRCKYFNEKDFMSSVIGTKKQFFLSVPGSEDSSSEPAAPDPGQIAGGVVPHHLLAGEMIAGFFEALSHSSPDTIVVIAPNHKRVGANGIHTSPLGWGTPFGVLEADRSLAAALIHDFNASQNTMLMEEEHSISSLAPYIKYYLPDAKILPVLLHGNYPAEASAELGEWLAGLLADKTDGSGGSSNSPADSGSGSGNPPRSGGPDRRPRIAVVASVDFSHYLDKDTAGKMDAETLAAIQSNDMRAISRMGNDNLDSPPSITVLMRAMEKAGISAPKVLAHSNSSDITGSGADYTTSYYTLLYSF